MSTAITPSKVDFYDDYITAFKSESGEVYAVINQVLRNIGFDDARINNIRTKWIKDLVISRGVDNFILHTNGGNQAVYCIQHRMLPLALAKIGITPRMQRECNSLVNKLIKYQIECGDILHNYFFGKDKADSLDVSLSSEEFALYITHMRNETEDLVKRLDQRINVLEDNTNKVQNAVLCLPTTQPSWMDASNAKAGSEWENRMVAIMNSVGKMLGTSQREVRYGIYDVMRSRGACIDQMYKKYKSNDNDYTDTMLYMISLNKVTQLLFEYALAEYGRRYLPEKFGECRKLSKAQIYNSTPYVIGERINRYAEERNVTKSIAARDIYKKVESRTGIKLRSEVRKYAEKVGVSKCRTSRYIADHPECYDAFMKITEAEL